MGVVYKAEDTRLKRIVALNPNNAQSHFFPRYPYRYVALTEEAVWEMG